MFAAASESPESVLERALMNARRGPVTLNVVLRAFLGDRRGAMRFQVVGELWTSVDVRETVVIRNISPGGALLETRLGPAARAGGAAYLRLPERGPDLLVAVRHVTPLPLPPTNPQFLLGVEFVRLSTAARSAVEAFIRARTEASAESSAL